MSSNEFQGQAPWIVITAIILSAVLAFLSQEWRYRIKQNDMKKAGRIVQDDRLEIHRDELTFQLLQNARLEMAGARVEVEDLREEVRKLRSMENHFFYFQQSLDHLEALLFPENGEARAIAERNARAFLTRMRRLNEAKGTLANEAQRSASEIELLDRGAQLGKNQGE